MDAYECTGSQYRGNEVSATRGDVGVHHLGCRVAGNFPDTSCPHSFWSKKKKNGQQPHPARTKARINDCFNLSNANAHHHRPKPLPNGENVRPARLCANT